MHTMAIVAVPAYRSTTQSPGSVTSSTHHSQTSKLFQRFCEPLLSVSLARVLGGFIVTQFVGFPLSANLFLNSFVNFFTAGITNSGSCDFVLPFFCLALAPKLMTVTTNANSVLLCKVLLLKVNLSCNGSLTKTKGDGST